MVKGDVAPEFWSGKRVFLTGHTGFKGSWMALWLQQMGAQVTGFALAPPTSPALFEVARVAHGMTSIIGDIRDQQALQEALVAADPQIVIHMAAQPLVRASYDDPVGTYATNVMGTVHLLEAVRKAPNVRAVCVVTTDKCYENREWVWAYREDEAMGGYDPYSNSKGCAELVVSAYRRSFFGKDSGVALASGRAGNVIGGGDWAVDRLIPDILTAIAAGDPVTIRNPLAIRPWQHVLEPVGGYLVLCQELWNDPQAAAQAWNFGPRDEDARPVQWIVERMCALWGENARWVRDESVQPHEARYLKLDISKARAGLHWQPRWPLAEALDRIVAWHRAWLSGNDMHEYCLSELERFARASHTIAA
ncbi:CDP-glucose 4,6-dehydratase [Sphingomonas yabuuchiae]|uniref:CDP-glucose 4,6-dehydratase n=1 Tax=Sphingomonas yabuuchiae TaxID=172044 RepID=A0A147ISU0_9SPHN|nr:CDP-glucose 4,6-dehydratase [Sphingomonas yabuuchiae]KTT98280.1 CDP-glucose 4,6-dehydratase [Sphingomonas yabuuchiae]